MQPILELARKYGLAVIEDATESLGAKYQGRMVGQLGDVACFSFNGNKLITTGGGGMVVTDNKDWAKKAAYLTTQAKDDPVEFTHGEIGYNYRLTNLLAALGCAQLEQIDAFISAKHGFAGTYTEALKSIPGLTPMREAPWADSVFWLFTVLVDRKEYGMDSRQLLKGLETLGIQTRPLWQPGHTSLAHAGSQAHQKGVAERLYKDALSLPCSTGLDAASQRRVLNALTSLAGVGQPKA
jgi:perosamine synthetase